MLYDTCVEYPTNNHENCIAFYSATNNTIGSCKACKKGFMLNLDEVCVSVQVTYCKNSSWIEKDANKFFADELYRA